MNGRWQAYGRIFEFDEVEGPFGSAWDSLNDLLTEMLALLEGRSVGLAHRIPSDYPRAPDPLKAVIHNGELEWERQTGDRRPSGLR
ncbi:hypothetical protein ACFY03_07175 [Micromonospora chersina]|uniref:hypothetical protein n=1 Tax=Micromonospora chersina TaxID=47854 RepID=UPI003694FA94